jgi:hypothetical protein
MHEKDEVMAKASRAADTMAGQAMGGCRQSARGVLRDMIDRAERRLHQLQALDEMLPLVIPPEQEQLLWALFIDMR